MCLEKVKNSKTIEELYSVYEDEMHASTAENKEIIEQMLKIEEPFYENLTFVRYNLHIRIKILLFCDLNE